MFLLSLILSLVAILPGDWRSFLFSHPILAGLALASFMPLFWFSGIRKWPWFAGMGASVFSVLSASSAAFLALLLAAALLTLDWAQRVVTFLSWKILIPAILSTLGLIHVVSETGIVNVIIRYSLNPTTARFRRLIWEYGTRSVEEHPWFGIGFTAYERLEWMIPSVDNHWLLLGIRFGVIPAFGHVIVFTAAIVLLCLAAGRSNEVDRRTIAGLAISLTIVLITGFTVAFFGGAVFWFYMLAGIGFSVAMQPAAQQRAVVSKQKQSGHGLRARRDLPTDTPGAQPRQPLRRLVRNQRRG